MSLTDPKTAPGLLTYQQVAERLGVSYPTVKRYAAAGHLAVVRINPRCARVREADVEAFIAKRIDKAVA